MESTQTPPAFFSLKLSDYFPTLDLYENSDVMDAYKNFQDAFPDKTIIRKVYDCLCNFFQLAMGSGRDTSYNFNIIEFSEHYNLSSRVAYNAIKFLEKEGYVVLSESFNEPSKLFFSINNTELYKFQLQNPRYENFIKLILRLYTGLFNDYVKIDEHDIAQKMNMPFEQTIKTLKELMVQNVLHYDQRSDLPAIIFTSERQESRDILLSDENYKILKENALKRLEAITEYVSENSKCRNQFLLDYFGETNSKRCGICDVCVNRNQLSLSELQFDKIVEHIKHLLSEKSLSLTDIIESLKGIPEDKLIKTLQWLTDNSKIIYEKDGTYRWNT